MGEFLTFTTLFNAAIFIGIFAIRRSIPIKTQVLIIAFSMSVFFCFLYPLLASYFTFPFVIYVYILLVVIGAILLFFIERLYFAPEADDRRPDGYTAGSAFTVMESAVPAPSAYPVYKPLPGIGLGDKGCLPGERIALPAGNSPNKPFPEPAAGLPADLRPGLAEEEAGGEYQKGIAIANGIAVEDSRLPLVNEPPAEVIEIISADAAAVDNRACAHREPPQPCISIGKEEEGFCVPVSTPEFIKPENEDMAEELSRAVFSVSVFPDVYQCACTDADICRDDGTDELLDDIHAVPQNIQDECLEENILLLENEYNRNMEEVVDEAVEEAAAAELTERNGGFEVGYYIDDSPYDCRREDCLADRAAAPGRSSDALQEEQPAVLPGHCDINSMVDVAFDKKSSGDLAGAVAVFMQALRLNPSVRLAVLICLEMSAIYRDIGQTEQAAAVLDMLLARWGTAIDGKIYEVIKNSINELKGEQA